MWFTEWLLLRKYRDVGSSPVSYKYLNKYFWINIFLFFFFISFHYYHDADDLVQNQIIKRAKYV